MTQDNIIFNKKCYSFIILTNSIVNKAIVSLMYSSSLSANTIRNLKVKDLINACSKYFYFYEDKNIENLLKKNPADIIPVWCEKSPNKLKITFSSPESLFYIFLHLKYRMNHGTVNENDYLFVNSNNNQISENNITNIFKNSEKLNDIMLPRKVGGIVIPYDLQFTSKDLKKNFIFVCENVLPEIKGKKSFIKLLTNGVNENNTYYNKFLTNIDGLRYYYQEYILPHVTAKNFEFEYEINDLKVGEIEQNKCPDVFLKQIIVYYFNIKFSDKIELKNRIQSSREYYDMCLEFKKALKTTGITDIDNDDNKNKLKEYLDENGLIELNVFLEPEEFKEYKDTVESSDFKEDYLETIRFEKTSEIFLDLCVEYNEAFLFKASDDFFDSVWVKADIQAFFEEYERSFSIKITQNNIKQKMINIMGLLNELNFFDRYDYKKSMYDNNKDFDPQEQAYTDIMEMLLKDLHHSEVSSININLANIVDMLQGIEFKFK